LPLKPDIVEEFAAEAQSLPLNGLQRRSQICPHVLTLLGVSVQTLIGLQDTDCELARTDELTLFNGI
jgi:hypothetical protein